MNQKPLWRSLASAAVVAFSITIVWGIVAGWAGSIVTSWFSPGINRYEQLHIAADGTPLIVVRDNRDWNNADYFTIDRQPIELEVESGLGGASLTRPYQPPAIFPQKINWQSRLGGMPNYSKPFAAWYAIRDTERPGHAYFVAYNPVTNLPTAYASRSGVTPTPPARKDWFDVGDHGGLNHAITSSGYFNTWNGYVYNQGVATDEGSILQWMAYIKDGDRLLELDTRNQRLQTVAEVNGLQSVNILSEPLPAATEDGPDEDKDTSRSNGRLKVQPVSFNQDTFTTVDVLSLDGNATFLSFAPNVDSKRKTRQRLAAVGLDEVLLIDPKTDTIDRFVIPELLRDRENLLVYSIGDGQLLFHSPYWGNQEEPGRVDLYWTNAAGDIARETTAQLATLNHSGDDWRTGFLIAGAAPVPTAWLAGCGVVAPLGMIDQHEVADLEGAYQEVAKIALPALVAVVAVGLLLAAYTCWKHRRLYRPGAAWWAGLVFLFGPAGLIAYVLHWRRPPMELCAACNQSVPRNREQCPACGAEWAAPEPIGIELIA